MAVGIRHTDHVAPTSGGRSIGIVCLRTQAKEFFLQLLLKIET
jgi:hypothetical protein